MFESVDLVLQETDQVAHGGDGGHLGLVQFADVKLFLQGHGQVHDIHGVGVQIIEKGSFHGDGVGVETELLGDQFAQFLPLLYAQTNPLSIGFFDFLPSAAGEGGEMPVGTLDKKRGFMVKIPIERHRNPNLSAER